MRAKYLSNDDSRREPEEISDLIGSIIESASLDVDIRHGDLVGEWLEFAPPDWRLGTPVGVRDGVLLVVVPDGTTASLLRYQTGPLLEAIEARFGADLVAAVRVRVERRGSRDFPRE